VLTYFAHRTRTARTIASIGAAILVGLSGSAPSQAQDEISSAERCLAANLDVSLGTQLPRTGARLNSGEPLKIVAIGSSSTVGLWVFRSAATYPEVMRRELSRLRSNGTIKVINSGRIGDTIPNNIARFERDVFAHTPDLVIWQLGTNDVAWGGRPDQGLKRSVLEEVRALKAGSSDVVLMDLQYAPQVLASGSYPTMEGIIIDVAKQERVGLFSRFALMRNSINAGVAQSALVTFDGLHNTADGYDCIGRALANECALTGVARPNRKLRLRMSWALAAKRARERQQDQILLDDHRDGRSQWVTAIRADAVRRCAHAPLRQRTY